MEKDQEIFLHKVMTCLQQYYNEQLDLDQPLNLPETIEFKKVDNEPNQLTDGSNQYKIIGVLPEQKTKFILETIQISLKLSEHQLIVQIDLFFSSGLVLQTCLNDKYFLSENKFLEIFEKLRIKKLRSSIEETQIKNFTKFLSDDQEQLFKTVQDQEGQFITENEAQYQQSLQKIKKLKNTDSFFEKNVCLPCKLSPEPYASILISELGEYKTQHSKQDNPWVIKEEIEKLKENTNALLKEEFEEIESSKEKNQEVQLVGNKNSSPLKEEIEGLQKINQKALEIVENKNSFLLKEEIVEEIEAFQDKNHQLQHVENYKMSPLKEEIEEIKETHSLKRNFKILKQELKEEPSSLKRKQSLKKYQMVDLTFKSSQLLYPVSYDPLDTLNLPIEAIPNQFQSVQFNYNNNKNSYMENDISYEMIKREKEKLKKGFKEPIQLSTQQNFIKQELNGNFDFDFEQFKGLKFDLSTIQELKEQKLILQ